jgi:hypothetical protein
MVCGARSRGSFFICRRSCGARSETHPLAELEAARHAGADGGAAIGHAAVKALPGRRR